MADPATYRPKPGEVPTDPGVYRFFDAHNRVIYVGKAKSLRARLNSYFQDLAGLHPRTQQMVTSASRVEWTVVANEVEALTLEYTWIQEFKPRFNVQYRDDKSYPYLAITMGEEIPRVQVMRGKKKTGTRYFGPYTHVWAIRETVDLLLRVFPVRSCSAGVLKRAQRSGRPCLLGYIGKCSAPCVGWITPEDHRELAENFADFMAGNTSRFTRQIEKEMQEAAENQEYEKAARLRDDLLALRKAMEKNAVVFSDSTDADVFALAADELEVSVQVFHVRGGRIRGQRGWVGERVEDVDEAGLVEHLLQQVYGAAEPGSGAVPREVLVPTLPEDAGQLSKWLRIRRGSNVDVRVPQRGEKRALAETVHRNAEQALALHKTCRSSDLTTRSQALKELQEYLDLSEAPLRIEAYDISMLQSTHVVGSMVVFEDGLARKSEYRRFTVRGDEGLDDLSAMREVLRRRFRRINEEQAAPSEMEPERPRFAYPPQLLVIDGGAPQVAAAATVLDELGIVDVALCGLAKRLEEVWLPGEDYPLVLPRNSEALYLLQRVRDEAHRFAISFHRKRRAKSMVASALDDIPGLGPTRRKALLKHFGSVKKIRAAAVEEIAKAPGIGPVIAAEISRALRKSS
ncbi:MAG TPA: excinuclease ABC subunit UvrC [Actinomycetales bacterium]|nr:excinuclease ABC subunit UvrC [Actinomycetales bacterium]